MKNKDVEQGQDRLFENLLAKVRNREPILQDPEGLTDDIMKAIRDMPDRNEPALMQKTGELPAIIIIRRLLAAASVCLLLVFGYEEYVVVEKISRLEKQSSAISRSSQYQVALNLKNIATVFTTDPGLINQYFNFKSKKIDIMTIFKASMLADAGGFSPDNLSMISRSGLNSSEKDIISIINNFDTTHHTRQK